MSSKLAHPPVFAFLLYLLCGLFTGSDAIAADNWVEVKCPHFTVAGNSSEKDLRKVCDQFELFRSMFRSAFPSLQVDPGTPVEIIAAKNEATMKELLPDQYEVKGHTRAAGIYQPGPAKIFVILQMNLEGDRPYHVLYHEYTHTLVHLNFVHVPLWLDEGLAEYLGNASLDNKEVRIGLIPEGHLYILQQNRLLPIETLFAVDHNSPYYNEANRTSVFYAESWALTHYLMLDQKARQEHLLANFLRAMSETGDQVAAARTAFGDLKKFGNTLDAYARSGSFFNGIVKPSTEALDKNYAVRALSPAEAMTLRGEFLVMHGRMKEAKALLDEAVKADPNLAAAHEAMGMYNYRNGNFEETNKEMNSAIRLGSSSFAPYYMAAITTLRAGFTSEEQNKQSIENLEKALKINANFAPGYDALAGLLRRLPAGIPRAVNAEMQAVKLDSSNLVYAMNLTSLLLAADRDKDAAVMADRIAKVASTEQEKRIAAQMVQGVNDQIDRKKREKETTAETQNNPQAETRGANDRAIAKPTANEPSNSNQGDVPKVIIDRAPSMVDGAIAEAVCGGGREITITLSSSGSAVRYHAGDLNRVEIVEGPGRPAPESTNCNAWKGRLIRVWFRRPDGKDYAGEITKLYFF